MDAAAGVEEVEDAGGSVLEHLQAAVVVAVLDGGQLHTLPRDDGLLRLEHRVQEELVELFVGKVDAELRESEEEARRREGEKVNR